MIGPEGAAEALRIILADQLPAKVTAVTGRLNATRLPRIDRELLTVKTIDTFDVLDLPLDAWPAVLVIAQRLVSLTRVDYGETIADAGAPLYRSRYATRTLILARGRTGVDDPGQRGRTADIARKRLLLAAREVYLEQQTVGVTIGATVDVDPSDPAYRAGYTVRASIDETTLVESYSDTLPAEDDTIAAAYIELDVIIEETIEVDPVAALPAEVNVDVTAPIPPPS